MKEDQKKKEGGPRNFGVFLAQLEDGQFLADIGNELHHAHGELSKLAEHHSKAKGKVTLELEIVHNANGVVDVTAGFKIALPKTKRARSTFWTTADGALDNKNPKQAALPFKDVNADSPAKDIAAPGRVVKEVGNG